MKLKFNTALFTPSDIVVVAVSGGVDSMVLLNQLISLKKSMNLVLHVVHMNYHKRLTSDQNQRFVEEFSKEHNLPFQSYDFDNYSNENFQMVARDERYQKFYQYAKKVNASKVALAHHLDDQAETILMRLTRGSSFIGYSGMKDTTLYKDLSLVRPLLDETKENIIAYAKEHHIDFQEDESNQSNDYTRNRFRHNVLPLLKEENPAVLEKINQFSEYLSSAYELVLQQANLFLKNHVLINDGIHTFSIIGLISSKKPNLQKRISNLVYVYKAYDLLRFQNNEEDFSPYEFILEDYGTVHLPSGDKVIISKMPDINSGKSIDLWYNNLDSFFPITIRNRKTKDTLIYPYGSKKLKDLLIDKKIPMKSRNTLPLILDSKKQIVYIPNLYKFEDKEHLNKVYITYLKG